MHVHQRSQRTTSHLVASMVGRDARLDLEDHCNCVVCWGLYGCMEWLGHNPKCIDTRGISKPAVKCQDILVSATGLYP